MCDVPKIRLSTLLLCFLLICEVVYPLTNRSISFLKYADEIVSVIMMLIVARYLMCGKIKGYNRKISYIMFFLVVLGIVSNYYSGVRNSLFPIAIDIVSTIKVMVCFVGFSLITNVNTAESVIKKFWLPAKILIYTALPFGIISQFVNIGMTGSYRFGLNGFRFIFGYAHIFEVMVLISVIVLSICEKRQAKLNKYLLLAAIEMLLTLKGVAIIWSIAIFFLVYYYEKKKKMNVRMIILLVVISVFFGSYQINTYLMNENAPRRIFFIYGLKTAYDFFPLGSGFATFGSSAAADYYSPLYRMYGFNNLYGMNESDTAFLNDTYWPMVIAQFGWAGFALVFLFYFYVFKMMEKIPRGRKSKAIAISSLLFILVHSIGSSTPTSSVVVILFSFLAVYLNTLKNETENNMIACERFKR